MTATGNTTAVADALAKTVARESAAARSHDQKALAAQQANARKLLPRLLTAFRREWAAGPATAALLRANGVDAKFPASAVARARTIIAKRLSKAGIPTATLNSTLGSASRPKATTLTASLAAR